MEVISGLKDVNIKRPTILTVGTFDGVHLGHQKIINQLVATAEKNDLLPILITFEPHPKLVVNTKYKNPIYILSDLEEKVEIFRGLGLKKVIVIEFTKNFSKINHQDFIKDILISKLNAKFIIIGHDHAFGSNRAGAFRELDESSVSFGFKLKKINSIGVNGNIISSSVIRGLILEGQIEMVSKMMGRPYSFKGIVVKGAGRGKSLLFPTANIQINNKMKIIPKEGVYSVNCELRNKNYRGMVNIGFKPTFGSIDKTIEVHIFDFDQNIYGELIKLYFLKRLRNEKKFNNQNELIKQLMIDKKNSYF